MWKRQLILSVLWLAAVGWYWREYVPLLPTRSAKLQYESFWAGWTSEGHVVVSGGELDPTQRYVRNFVGPVSYWRLPELGRLSEQFEPEDVIEQGTMNAAYGLVVIGRGSQRRIVDSRTGDTLEEVPPDVPKVWFERRSHPNAVYIRDDSITLRDPRLSKDIWKTAGVTARVVDFYGDLVLLYEGRKTGPAVAGPRQLLLLKIATGEVDTRFDATRPFDSLSISPDGRWALVQNFYGRYQICDARTGRSLWTLKVKVLNWPQFDTKREELVVQWATPNGEYRESRWRCADGAEASPPPESSHWAERSTDSTGRYAIDVTTPRGYLEEFCRQYLNPPLQAIGSKTRLPEERTIRVLRDLSTGEVIGPLPTDGFMSFIPGGSAAVAIAGKQIDVYEFPARRDWGWLAWFGLTPVATAFAARFLWAVRQRRARTVR